MSWSRLEEGAPELAAFGRRRLEDTHVLLVGSIRREGTPRMSVVEGCIIDGRLYLGMMRGSRKAEDLIRDPRIVLRNSDTEISGGEGELTLRGTAVLVDDPGTVARFVDAVASRTTWKGRPFHLFSVSIEQAALVTYDTERGEMTTRLWPGGVERVRPYP